MKNHIFYIKYIGKVGSVRILLSTVCTLADYRDVTKIKNKKENNELRVSPFVGVVVYPRNSDSCSRTVDSLDTSILTINFFKCSTASASIVALLVPGEAVKPRIYKVKNDRLFLWLHTVFNYSFSLPGLSFICSILFYHISVFCLIHSFSLSTMVRENVLNKGL